MIGSHIIPRFYLEQFATPSKRGPGKPGRIWVYEQNQEPDERATSVQGKEKGYFGYFTPNGTLEESFETVLADRENECNDILACSRFDTFPWPLRAREKLAFYAALLFSRATQRRDHAVTQWGKIMAELRHAETDDQLVKEIADAVACKLDLPAPKEAVRNRIGRYIRESETPQEAKNNFLSGLLDNAELIAKMLLAKEPWRVLRPAEDSQFITTDNPLVTFVPLGNGLLHPGYGFRKEIADAAFPLAPDACLLMGKAWAVPRTLETGMIASLNEALIAISDRYVYSKVRSDEINDKVQKYAGSCRYGVSAFMPVGLELPTARQFLRLHFGLDPE